MIEAALIDAVRVLKNMAKLNLGSQIDRVRIDGALQSLRQIFFFSTDLRQALEDISQGDEPNEILVDYFIMSFAETPQNIQEALRFIDIDIFTDRNTLSIDHLQLMKKIRYGKINIRKSMRDFFDDYKRSLDARSEHNKVRMEAARLLAQIDSFNSEIKSLESKLMRVRAGEKRKVISRVVR